MPRSRTPKAKAELTGATERNPGRFAGRNDPAAAPLGEPSAVLKGEERDAWQRFVAELPWLVESDRALLELASALRAKVLARGGMGINVVQVYSAVLSKLGATPSDRSRVSMPDQPVDDEFFPV